MRVRTSELCWEVEGNSSERWVESAHGPITVSCSSVDGSVGADETSREWWTAGSSPSCLDSGYQGADWLEKRVGQRPLGSPWRSEHGRWERVEATDGGTFQNVRFWKWYHFLIWMLIACGKTSQSHGFANPHPDSLLQKLDKDYNVWGRWVSYSIILLSSIMIVVLLQSTFPSSVRAHQM